MAPAALPACATLRSLRPEETRPSGLGGAGREFAAFLVVEQLHQFRNA